MPIIARAGNEPPHDAEEDEVVGKKSSHKSRKRKPSLDSAEQLATAKAHFVMAAGEMQREESYLRRGRRFQHLSEAELRELHASAFKKYADNPRDPEASEEHSDCVVEHSIRGLTADYSELRPELASLIKIAETVYKSLDEAQLREIEAQISQEYEAAGNKEY